ncbi:MAG: 50S ribosomal protein L35 [Candidatus Edwardsbacteria bacterium]
MPKIKTNKSAAKRFKRTATGKIKRYKAAKSHLLTDKSRKRKRALCRSSVIDLTDTKRIKRLLP